MFALQYASMELLSTTMFFGFHLVVLIDCKDHFSSPADKSRFYDLFDSIRWNNTKKTEKHFSQLGKQMEWEQKAFNSMKEELYKKRWNRGHRLKNLARASIKREISGNEPANVLPEDQVRKGKPLVQDPGCMVEIAAQIRNCILAEPKENRSIMDFAMEVHSNWSQLASIREKELQNEASRRKEELRTLWFLSTLLAVLAQGRRVRLKPTLSTEEPDAVQPPRQVLFYAEEPSSSEDDAPPVLIARQPSYARTTSPTLAPRSRTSETPRAPPVQTIRNYNKINDDGSFTFGYEAADGSFKEETRGTDCVVRGKYGYIDPDGNKREFTYVSGNPCDPNAISQEEEDELKDKSNDEDENIPPNIPQRRPNYVVRPVPKRPATTLFQQSFNNDDAGQEEDTNQLVEIRQRPTLRTSIRDEDQQLIRTTARPVARVTFPASTRFAAATKSKIENTEPATTYRPQVIQLGVTPSPATVSSRTTKAPYVGSSTGAPPNSLFDEQFKKFQLESNVIPSQQASASKPISSNPIYSTELVYDPNSGQYNTIVYQQVPKFGAEINFNQRLPSYVPSPSVPPTTPRLLPSTSTPSPYYQQQLIQQQQQAALVQQSQQLYNQQLRAQQQVQQQRQLGPPLSSPLPQTVLLKQNPQRYPQPIIQRYPPEPKPLVQEQYQQARQPPPPFYFINPLVPAEQQGNLAAGQIEAFLRGHNLPF